MCSGEHGGSRWPSDVYKQPLLQGANRPAAIALQYLLHTTDFPPVVAFFDVIWRVS